MWVTLYTDASVSPKLSTWAIWARSEKGRIVEGGACPEHVTDSNVAELYAVQIGIETIVQQWSPVTGIQINSDSLTVCNALYPWSTTHNNLHIRAVQDKIREFLASKTIRVRLKHVKGHQRPDGVREYLNVRCDQIANQVRKREERKISVKPNVIPNVQPNQSAEKPASFLAKLFGKEPCSKN